jgi:multiple sugar transport system substrate-binding protein
MASLIIGVLFTLTLVSTQVRGEPLQFLSTQLTLLPEAAAMRKILKNFPREVNFRPIDDQHVFKLLMEQCTKGSNRIDLIGALHGDFSALVERGYLRKVDDILAGLKGREFVEDFIKFGKLGRENQTFIPWMQATYVMVANRRALKHLPKGAELTRLSYDQLKAWAVNMRNATGEAKLGFPVEPDRGLMHRFLQGYLYPSFTGSTLRQFRSPEAEAMWREFRDLWQYVNPRSLTFSEMDRPLLAGEVWVAWDHMARMRRAFQQQPKEFIAFPPPAGPKGRGFMTVLAGLAIPKCAPESQASGELIEFLTRPGVQLDILRKVFFFPVVHPVGKEVLSPGLDQLNEAVTNQSIAKDGIKTLLPVGLGEKSNEFNTAYKRTFSQIVLRGRDIKSVLAKQTKILRRILSETEAPCWPPDEPSTGPCPVE